MALPIRSKILESLDYSDIGPAYIRVGNKIQNSLRIIWIQNLTDATLLFSFRAPDNHFPLAPNAFILLDVNSNQLINQSGLFLGIGTQLSVKQLDQAPTSGAVYFSGFYGKGE